jgi:hypothetical protein
MISTEVRIGNLVEFENRIFEIDVIANEFPTLNTSEFGIGVVDWNNIKPIPLTEEWLVKFEWQLIGKITYFINSYFSIDKFGHVYYSNDYTGLNIDYVHQLQNLYFALTGTELIKTLQ